MKWEEIVPSLPNKAGYNNLEIGINKKRVYIAKHLPELMCGEDPKSIADIGAGCGFFCRACMDLGHKATAILHPKHSSWSDGFIKACNFLEVPFKLYNWGIGNPPFEHEECDVVNSEGMLGMNAPEDWEKILDEMLCIIKQEGTLLLAVNRTRYLRNRKILVDWTKNRPVEMVEQWEHNWKWKKLA